MLKRLNIGTRVCFALVLFASLLGATLSFADTRDADLVRQGTDAFKHREYDIAISQFSDALRLAPENAEASSKRGEAYAHKGDNDRALADCAQAIKLVPRSSEVFRRCGNVYSIAEDFERAITNYDTAIRLDPHIASAYANRGSAFYDLGKIDRAISDYDQALKLDPSLSNTYASRGNAWFVKGDFNRPWDDYNRAIQADPGNAYAYASRGFAAASRYAFDDAIADYDRAIRVDPAYQDAYRYRDEALKHKSDAAWGKVYLILLGIGMLALLFAGFRAYFSPTAFDHSVQRHFKRMPDERLVFYPGMKRVGYVVPDAEREQALRVFERRRRAVSLVSGLVIIGLTSALLPIVLRLISWLSAATGISVATIILVTSFAEVTIIMAGIFRGFSLWRRAATHGLVEAPEKEEPPQSDQWTIDFVLDMPVAVRWIVLAVIIFAVFESFKGLWRVRQELSLAGIEHMSIFGWLLIGANLSVLWYFGQFLVFAARQRGRQARQAGRAA